MRTKTLNARAYSLYWCSTEDHHEDWFVVHASERDARRFFMKAEGYSEEDVDAELVAPLPGNLQQVDELVGWPSDETLKACGATVGQSVDDHGSRLVTLGKRTFFEGALQSVIDRKLNEHTDDSRSS